MVKKINLIKDLKEIKKTDLERSVLDIIKKWMYQKRENDNKFREEFLDDNKDKYFDDLKDLVGEFKKLEKEIKDMSVLEFLVDIICGGSDYKILTEMHKEFLKDKGEVRKTL